MSDAPFEKLWRCSCGGSHFVSVTAFDWGNGEEDDYSLTFHVEEYPMGGHWERIKAALKLVFKRRHNWIEIILDKEKAEEVANEILLHASKLKKR